MLDEPYSNLDIIHKSILKEVIDDIIKHIHITCLLVSHDPLDTLSWADVILVMKKGKVIQQGSPNIIYTKPFDEYVAGLFGKFTLVSPAHFKSLSRFKSRKAMILRPEHFSVQSKGKNGLEGIVKATLFYGNYYQLEVMITNHLFFVQTSTNRFSVGDRVIVKLKDSK